MTFFSDLQTALDALRHALGDDMSAVDVPTTAHQLADDSLVGVIERATVLLRGAESIRIAASGVAASRSTREAGHRGLAQQRGHRSAISLIQDLTGTRRAEAAKQVRLGEALGEARAESSRTGDTGEGGEVGADRAGAVTFGGTGHSTGARPWRAVLGDALLTGALTSAQHDVIFRGLGAPPLTPITGTGTGMGANSAVDYPENAADVQAEAAQRGATAINAEILSTWETAATQLIDEAAVRTVEELASAARAIRDLLDPESAGRRFETRFDGRSFRTWIDRDGARHGHFRFDDEGGAWIDTIITTALRPRRGGPRFVDAEEKVRAEALARDPRTNDQLSYDLVVDVLRAGSLADPAAVFGTRQPGIRVVATETSARDAAAGKPAVALLEDADITLPGWLIAQRACDSGMALITLDERGNPLDLGREARLYTARQRLALAVRDGGCRWLGCDRPASYCEAHHIDPYAQGGRTDIARGILLCRFHHMQLHNGGWRVSREAEGEFLLHQPDGAPPLALPARLPRRYAFGLLKPPTPRLGPAG